MVILLGGGLIGCPHLQELLLHHAWQEAAEHQAHAEQLWQAYVD